MSNEKHFDVIIVGGSYSGLAAAMALGRSLRKVLVIDSGKPCNRQTPHSHNFLTQDGNTPKEIATLAKHQVSKYDTVTFYEDIAVKGSSIENGFEIHTEHGATFKGRKIIFATGVQDLLPELPGFTSCWGISVLHCPYCHGYEVRNEPTGILANGTFAFEYVSLISNWTKELTLFTNGLSSLTPEQEVILKKHSVKMVEGELKELVHREGHLEKVVLKDGTQYPVTALYTRPPFEQHCSIPKQLGCELTEEGYIKTDAMQKTSVPGAFASGDNTTPLRTVANAVSSGTFAGMVVNKELVGEDFK